jgi:8-oxo-dGTP diphosphatase
MAAVVRETKEEAGCEIKGLQYLGNANQYFLKTETGPLNKLATFYKARLAYMDPSKRVETDHEVHWFAPEKCIKLLSGEFQKWAVKQVLG